MNNNDLRRFFQVNENLVEKNDFVRLDNNKKVPSKVLPSYVDDIVEGYYYNNNFYNDENHTSLITAEKGKIYVDIPTGYSYRWTGTQYVQIGNIQADFNQNDSSNPDYIKNRPVIHTQGRYVEDDTVKTSSGSMAQTGTTTSEDSGWVQPQAEGRGSAAFGRGTIAGGQEDWNNPDTANHDYAFASGKNSKAYGDSSFAANRGTKVTGANAAAFNESTEAQGKDSFVCGYGSKAYSKGAFASGYYTEANGEYSFTANSSDTNGKYAFAAGEETRATNEAATSFGRSTQATAQNSMATGHSTLAQHIASFTAGRNTQTSRENQMVIGEYNADNIYALFIVGDGTSDNERDNCFAAGKDTYGPFINIGNVRVHQNEIRSINGMSGGTLTSQLVITGGDASSNAKIAISNAGSGQITDEGTHTLFGFTADGSDTLTVGHNNYKMNLRGSESRPQYKGSDLALLSDISSISSMLSTISGYDATKNQVLKNIQGTFTWVDET